MWLNKLEIFPQSPFKELIKNVYYIYIPIYLLYYTKNNFCRNTEYM